MVRNLRSHHDLGVGQGDVAVLQFRKVDDLLHSGAGAVHPPQLLALAQDFPSLAAVGQSDDGVAVGDDAGDPALAGRHQLQVGMPLFQVRKLFLVAGSDQDLHLRGEDRALTLGDDPEQAPNQCLKCEAGVHNLLLVGSKTKTGSNPGH